MIYTLPVSIHTFSACSSQRIVSGTRSAYMVTLASATWGAANRAVFIPLYLPYAYPIVKIGTLNGAAVSGNIDLGIYDSSGNKIASTGSTVQAGTTAVQFINLAVNLAPGLYFMAQAMDNTTGTRLQPGGGNARGQGHFTMESAFPLPATATFADAAQTTHMMGITMLSGL